MDLLSFITQALGGDASLVKAYRYELVGKHIPIFNKLAMNSWLSFKQPFPPPNVNDKQFSLS